MFHRAEIQVHMSFPKGVQEDTLDKVHTALDGFFLKVSKSIEYEVESAKGVGLHMEGVVPSGISDKLIFDSLVSQLPDAEITQVILGINRKLDENNQVVGNPGYYFHPLNKEGLIELTDVERFSIWRETTRSDFAVFPNSLINKLEYADMMCVIENSNTPTHRSEAAAALAAPQRPWVVGIPSVAELVAAAESIKKKEAELLNSKKED